MRKKSYFFEFASRKFLTSRRLVLFGAELQISGKFLRVETNLYLHTQREAKLFENRFAFKNFAVQTKHVFLDHVHTDYVFSYAFQYQGVGGRVSLCLLFVENSTFALPVLLPTRGLFQLFCLPKAVSAAGGNANISPIAC